MNAIASKSTESLIERPSYWLTWSEPFRAGIDFLGLVARLPQLAAAPRGDGHPVLVLPGFGTSDMSTALLRAFLRLLGYRAEGWELGYNTGYRKVGEDAEALVERLRDVSERTGEKVSIVGWSLGGVMARRLAREHPGLVKQVITLGSPFTGNQEAITIKRIYKLISGEDVSSFEGRKRYDRDRPAPTDVPTTAIYSRRDGITAWENCVEEKRSLTANREVRASHLGLPYDADVFLAVAETLAAPVPRK